jgi:hypothetical protein
MTPMPQTAIALPLSAGGNALTITACDRGTRGAPATPCRSRKSTISSMDMESPHGAEATTKPAMPASMTFRRPKRSDRYPVSGIVTASATI